MSVNILDENALDKMALVEGNYWREYTTRTDNKNDYSFVSVKQFYLDAKKQLEEYLKTEEKHITEDLNPLNAIPYYMGNTVIYGDGGWNRYFVRGDGNICYSAYHGERKLEFAKEVGFDIC